MASKSGKISIGIRKATHEDLVELQKEIKHFSMPHPDSHLVLKFEKVETFFIARRGKLIVGFVSMRTNPRRKEAEIVALYNRIGYERKGIGSKLLGKASAFAVARGAKLVALTPSYGHHVVEGKKVEVHSRDFYDKTNFQPNDALTGEYIWKVKRKLGIRRPKKKPTFGLAPQNALRPGRTTRRR